MAHIRRDFHSTNAPYGTYFDHGFWSSETLQENMLLELPEARKQQDSASTLASDDNDSLSLKKTKPTNIYLSGWRLYAAIAGSMLSVSMISMEATIVGASIVPITTDLQHFDISSWIFSGYLLTFASFLLIFARMSDIFGRKLVLLVCLAVFSLFSLGCGYSQTMIQLIICRAFQGIGGSGVYAVNLTMTPELTAPKHIAWVISLNSGASLLMLILGLVFGGLISTHTTWRWIFWCMAPAGLISIALLYIAIPNSFPNLGTTETPSQMSIHPLGLWSRRSRDFWRKFDIIGSLLLLSTSVMFLFAIEEGSNDKFGWSSAPIITGFSVTGVSVLALIWYERMLSRQHEERRTEREPLLATTLFRARPVVFILLFAFLTGLPFYTLLFTLPERFQIVNFETPVNSAVRLLPFVAFIPFQGTITYLTLRFQIPVLIILFISASLFLVGVAGLTTAPKTFSTGHYVLQAVAGLGIGPCLSIALSYTTNLIRRKNPDALAVAMGLFLQARTLGGAVGSALTAVILKQKVNHYISNAGLDPKAVEILRYTPTLINTFGDEQKNQASKLYSDIFSIDLKMAAGATGLALLALFGCYEKKWARNGRKANAELYDEE
ncbi:hypothetical protein NA57DRAFT_72202 [Rhizodiscina lignyota]|uniref:Major facilitator superfamily (MFS) profile domain-containing protein n=1 Tax=Rhizodiscina lignyota TaxID=1504668 RepID=A0A9P4IPW5_9PEZI|nr:hypothetical protein NA57DRAFT_72202 [Rhizodiscina lignyota]